MPNKDLKYHLGVKEWNLSEVQCYYFVNELSRWVWVIF